MTGDVIINRISCILSTALEEAHLQHYYMVEYSLLSPVFYGHIKAAALLVNCQVPGAAAMRRK